ncbi:hypothetical protein FS842_007388, partial [Serendipita sp. 407]
GFPLHPKAYGSSHPTTLSGPQPRARENFKADGVHAYVDHARNAAWQTGHSVHPLLRVPVSRGSGGLDQSTRIESSSPPHPRYTWAPSLDASYSQRATHHQRHQSLQEGLAFQTPITGTRVRHNSNDSKSQVPRPQPRSSQVGSTATRYSSIKGYPDNDISPLSSSPPSSPTPFVSALGPVHVSYRGLPRTESGLIPIPTDYQFQRGEIVMTRTTRRLMRTSNSSRLTARHPCLILQTSATHVNPVGAMLQHWLAREDESHRDVFGRPGLRTSPPSERAGYIWVGDGGEWVPIECVKYLTGTRVEEGEMRRLETMIDYHISQCPFRPQPGSL